MQTEKEYFMTRELSALRCESVGEYSLPDYNTDVKKLLTVKTKVFPNGRFVGDDTLEFSGMVGYEAVYIDADNNVTHAEFSTDYEAAVKINSEAYVDSDVRTSVAGCNVRLVGPRKISVKCSLDNDVNIRERRELSVGGDAFMEYEPEVLEGAADVETAVFLSGQPREMSEEMLRLDGAITDEVEVLLTDARLIAENVAVGETSAQINGEMQLTALIKNADESPRLVSKKIPYSEELELSEPEAMESLEPILELSYLKSSVVPSEDGVSVMLSLSSTPKMYGRKNCRIELVRDAYLKERGTENEYSDFAYTEHICTNSHEVDFECKRPLSELGIEFPGDVIYVDAQARSERCEMIDAGVRIEGEIRFNGVAHRLSDEGADVYYPIKFALPFTENVNINCQKHDNMRTDCSISVNDVKINMDENSLAATARLGLFVTVSAEKRQRCLGASYLTDEEYLTDDSIVSVYYPDASESLFEIAKRFHTSVASIAESNRLTESVFASLGEPMGNARVNKLLIK